MLRTAALIIAAVFVLAIINPIVIVGPGERGVLVRLGKVEEEVFGEGLHLRVPITDRVIIVDVSIQKEQIEADASSKDLQDTHSTIAVNYHVDPEQANHVYQSLRGQYSSRVIDPNVQEVVKAVTARYTAVELITQREKVREEIKSILRERLAQYHVLVDDFSIVNFRFSPQFAQAIEAKQTAEQLAFKAQRDLERIKIEAEQKIASAQAEAESLRLQKENVTAELVQLRQIEAQMKAIDKWDGHMPQVTGSAMPFINLNTAHQ
jgi:regulator of protease activity HflC (stomatin/prohibitin superfamily)